MYNISKYTVVQELNETEILLYSTLSTSIAVLDKDEYESIFIRKDFSDEENCSDLCEMGFLFTGPADSQAEELKRIRREIVDADTGLSSVTIAPTMQCNARCYYCFENGAAKGRMSEETAERVAEFIIENCTQKELTLAWFGGEPLMADDIISLINSRLKEAGISVDAAITTNGILIDEKMIENFRSWNISRVQITLDGLGEEYNRVKKYILPIADPFERIISNIELLIKNEFRLHLRVNYLSTDYSKAKEILDYLYNKYGSYDNLYLYGAPLEMPQIKGFSEFTEEEGDIFLRILKYSLERGFENDEVNFRDLRVSEDYNVALGELMLSPFPAPCYMVNKNKFVIDDKGMLYKCQRHLGHSDFNCGNVFDGINKNDIYKYYVTAEVHNPECENCNMFPICQGGCNSNRLLYGDKFACPPSKTIIKKLVKEYYNYLINGNSFNNT